MLSVFGVLVTPHMQLVTPSPESTILNGVFTHPIICKNKNLAVTPRFLQLSHLWPPNWLLISVKSHIL